jgi:predicted RNA-binding protein with PIN domain
MPYWFDGNNLIGQSVVSAQADSRIRQAFLFSLSAYRKAGGGKFLVYFDGDDRDRKTAPTGVVIRYSAPLSADEAIVRRLREIRRPSEVIVVTNDRKLMRRCRDAGATTMGWNQFISKMRPRTTRARSGSKSQEPVDVDDWMSYFGWDKSDH